jgi:peptidase E
MSTISPIYLLADSQVLFWKSDSRVFMRTVLNHISDSSPRAAYLGVSNGDQPEFFEIFCAAMENIGLNDCRMVRTDFSGRDKDYLRESSLILLAGGDAVRGMRAFETSGLKDAILDRYRAGAVLIGVSAGAMQLGLSVWIAEESGHPREMEALRVVPAVIGTHEEQEDWASLRSMLRSGERYGKGFGISSGAGLIYHPDHTVEPIRGVVHEFVVTDGQVSSNVLFGDTPAGTLEH